MICPYCHQEHPDNTVFCPQTGKRIQEEKQACMENPDCPIHGQFILPIDSCFCPECGCSLKKYDTQENRQPRYEHGCISTKINFNDCVDELNNLYKLKN